MIDTIFENELTMTQRRDYVKEYFCGSRKAIIIETQKHAKLNKEKRSTMTILTTTTAMITTTIMTAMPVTIVITATKCAFITVAK